MKKVIILIVFLILPLANSITSEQKDILKEAIDSANTKYDFEKLMDLLNRQKVDLSDENGISANINSLSRKFNVDLANYPDIKGIKEKEINWTVVVAASLFVIVLIFEVYRIKKTKNKKEEESNIQQLEDYIKDALKKGYAKTEIREILLKNNWDEGIVDDVLRNI